MPTGALLSAASQRNAEGQLPSTLSRFFVFSSHTQGIQISPPATLKVVTSFYGGGGGLGRQPVCVSEGHGEGKKTAEDCCPPETWVRTLLPKSALMGGCITQTIWVTVSESVSLQGLSFKIYNKRKERACHMPSSAPRTTGHSQSTHGRNKLCPWHCALEWQQKLCLGLRGGMATSGLGVLSTW